MVFQLFQSAAAFRRTAGFCSLGFVLALSACQSASGTQTATDTTSGKPKVTQTELRAFCPPVVLRDGTSFFNSYAKGGEGDGTKLRYQVSINDVTRSCTYNGDQVTMKVAIAGRVVPGPVRAGGAATVPIRVAVTADDQVLYSQLFQHTIQTPNGSSATQFTFTDPNATFSAADVTRVRAFVGFDEGAPKKTAAAE